MAAGGNGRAKQ